MAVNFPDELKHNNPLDGLVDSDFVRGGTRTPVANLTALYALSPKFDQLKENATTVVVLNDGVGTRRYVLTDISNVGNSSGWSLDPAYSQTGFLGEWDSTKASTGYYNNKVNSLLSFEGVIYTIVNIAPGNAAPSNGFTAYFKPFNPIGERVIKTLSLGSGNCVDTFALRNTSTQQCAIKIYTVIRDDITGGLVESQTVDTNLSNTWFYTPGVWYSIPISSYKSEVSLDFLDRILFIDIMYTPDDIGSPTLGGTLTIRYRSSYGDTYTSGIDIKTSMVSNQDIKHLSTAPYTDTDTISDIVPYVVNVGADLYDNNGTIFSKGTGTSFDNGLTGIGSGVVGLGGGLTGDTQINIGNHDFNIYDFTYAIRSQLDITSTELSVVNQEIDLKARPLNNSSDHSYGELDLTAATTSLVHANSSNIFMELILQDGNATFYDNIHNKGLEYGADYSANFTGNSLITRAYGDSHYVTSGGIPIASSSILGGIKVGGGLTIDGTGVLSINNKVIGVKSDYGAVGDAILLTDGVTTSGSNIVTSASANFTSADIGKTIGIPYAGTIGTNIGQSFVSTIASINSTTSVTLVDNVVVSIAGPRTITDGIMTVGSNILTSATASFTNSDIGKKLSIPGVGPLMSPNAGTGTIALVNGAQTCWIYSVTNSTTVLVTKQALATISGATISIPGAWIEYGTNDTIAIQNAINAAVSTKTPVRLESSRYLTTDKIIVGSNLHLYGDGIGNSIISPVGSGFSVFDANNGFTITSTTLDLTLEDFEIDGFGVTNNSYITGTKGFYIRPITNFTVKNLYVHDASATGIGCDFLKNWSITNVIADHCGRQYREFGANAGGAGIGLGAGVYSDEAGIIEGCFATDNGSVGILLEGQTSGTNPIGAKIIGCSALWNGVAGIADYGREGSILANNTVRYNATGINLGMPLYQSINNYSFNTIVSENVLSDNGIPISIKSVFGGIKILNNIIKNTYSLPTTVGIDYKSADTGSIMKPNVIRGNYIDGMGSRGIYIENSGGGTFGELSIDNNTILNSGRSTNSAAIAIAANIATLTVNDNIAYDESSSSKTQTYGLSIGAITVTNFYYGGNSFINNLTAPDSILSATITNSIVRPTYERAGTWTALNTYSNGLTVSAGSITLSALTASKPLFLTSGKVVTTTGSGTNSQLVFGDGSIASPGGDITAVSGNLNIGANKVTYAKMQAMTANKLLGSGLSGTAVAEITLGTGLSFTGTTLNVTSGGSGTVTSTLVVSANGFAGTVATSTTTPAITISTTITGLLKGNGTAISAATAGTDYTAGVMTTAGDLIVGGTAGAAARLGIGSANTVLTSNGSASSWVLPPYSQSVNAATSSVTMTVGSTYLFEGSSAVTFTLPSATTASIVSNTMRVINAGYNTITLSGTLGDYSRNTGNISSFVVPVGMVVDLVPEGGYWQIVRVSQDIPLKLTASGTGSATTISIPHGQTGITSGSIVQVTAGSSAAIVNPFYATIDATNVNITYSVAPLVGTNNLTYNVTIRP